MAVAVGGIGDGKGAGTKGGRILDVIVHITEDFAAGETGRKTGKGTNLTMTLFSEKLTMLEIFLMALNRGGGITTQVMEGQEGAEGGASGHDAVMRLRRDLVETVEQVEVEDGSSRTVMSKEMLGIGKVVKTTKLRPPGTPMSN